MYLKLNREESDCQENCVWATNYFLAFFFSCFFSFVYKVLLQEFIVDICGGVIKVSDQIGVDTHFLRYLSMAMYDSRP